MQHLPKNSTTIIITLIIIIIIIINPVTINFQFIILWLPTLIFILVFLGSGNFSPAPFDRKKQQTTITNVCDSPQVGSGVRRAALNVLQHMELNIPCLVLHAASAPRRLLGDRC
jgi:hypothetical protein